MLYIVHADGSGAHLISKAQSRSIHTPSYKMSFIYYVPKNTTQINSFFYNLNGQSNVTLCYFSRPADFPVPYVAYSVFKNIKNLPNDNYKVEVYARFANGTVKSIKREEFTVNTNFIYPKLTIILPQNQAIYDGNNVPIIYSINSKVRWAYYALDKAEPPEMNEWIRFDGNSTHSGLSRGSHKLVISVQTEANMEIENPICEQKIYFEVHGLD